MFLQIALLSLIAFAITALIFPIDKWVKFLIEVPISKEYLMLLVLLGIVGVLTSSFGLMLLVKVFLIFVTFIFFIVLISMHRQILYLLAVFFLLTIPVFLLLKFNKFAEYSANLAYISMFIAIVKDLFYEELYK